MKFAAITTTTLAAASVAQAAITIVTPWADTTWNSGAHGNITWKAAGTDANQKCEIQLLNGNSSNANLVAYVTDPKLPVDCTSGSFDIYPLNDFAAGKYSIRIGQSASSTWAYSGVFNFVGKGAAKPLQVASGAAPASSGASAAASSGAAANGTSSSSASATGKTNSTSASAANASSSSTNGASSDATFSMAAVAAAAGLSALAMAL
ncbi:hypothetical protein BCR42DRAFT_428321 [Absidia repens]|uniref:Yeast cell wall synthesis Kre9/Knh1-like N-terminal domain-containing protein n=1 Tax=Absidia repens TaxID=90262 RepID=A0A1X2I043_9FUNG|nr:hypothetical protein BCR42DRAFT_428321 [Absidia repens]